MVGLLCQYLELFAYFSNLSIPAFSVFIRDCLYSPCVNGVTQIVKVQQRVTLEPTLCLHGLQQMKPSPRTNTDGHGCFELCKTFVLSSRYPDVPGQILLCTYTEATRFIHRIMLYLIRFDQAPIWEWGSSNKAAIAENYKFYSWFNLPYFYVTIRVLYVSHMILLLYIYYTLILTVG